VTRVLSISDVLQRQSLFNEKMRRAVEAAGDIKTAIHEQLAAATTSEEIAAVSRYFSRALADAHDGKRSSDPALEGVSSTAPGEVEAIKAPVTSPTADQQSPGSSGDDPLRAIRIASEVHLMMWDQFAAAKTLEEQDAASRACNRAVSIALFGNQKRVPLSAEEMEKLGIRLEKAPSGAGAATPSAHDQQRYQNWVGPATQALNEARQSNSIMQTRFDFLTNVLTIGAGSEYQRSMWQQELAGLQPQLAKSQQQLDIGQRNYQAQQAWFERQGFAPTSAGVDLKT
jgi:hypothetical protein